LRGDQPKDRILGPLVGLRKSKQGHGYARLKSAEPWNQILKYIFI